MFPSHFFLRNLFLARVLVFLPRVLLRNLPRKRKNPSPTTSPPHNHLLARIPSQYDLVADNRSALPCNQRQQMTTMCRFASPTVDFCYQRAFSDRHPTLDTINTPSPSLHSVCPADSYRQRPLMQVPLLS
jgi:hypothetical protein